MKRKYLILLALIFSCDFLFAQTPTQKACVLQGKLDHVNSKDKFIYLNFVDADNKHIKDSAKFEPNGSFNLYVANIGTPNEAELYTHRSRAIDIFIAPGYNITLIGDQQNYPILSNITGYGSKPNRYFVIRDSILSQRKPSDNFWKLNENDFLAFLNTRKKICDSVAHIVFGDESYYDLNSKFFLKNIAANIKFEHAHTIVDYVHSQKFDYKKTIAFVNNNLGKDFFNNLFDENNLAYSEYRNFMSVYYLYLEDLDCLKEPTLCNNKNDYNIKSLEKISTAYHGKIREKTLYEKMADALGNCRSYPELNMYRDAFPKYIAMLTEDDEKSNLNEYFVDTEKALSKTQAGKPAPDFTAVDSLSKTFSLADFKGKVILIDLWASWCAPCRAETPFLKKIEEKYQSDNRISFISIAVSDVEKNWKTAMVQDKVTGIQLFDKNRSVITGYSAYSIPKFVLINKEGKIVVFDAPPPHQTAELEKLLDEEIAK